MTAVTGQAGIVAARHSRIRRHILGVVAVTFPFEGGAAKNEQSVTIGDAVNEAIVTASSD